MVGCLGESFKNNSLLVTSFGAPVADFLLQHTFSFEDDELLRNGAFCLGVMCEKNPLAMTNYQANILAHLVQSAQLAQSQEAKENILAAMCRIVIGGNVAPLESLCADLFNRVPFVGDLAENKTVLRFYIHLCTHHSALAQANLGTILSGMVQGLANQKKWELSDKFVAAVAEKTKLLVANSEEAKEKVTTQVMAI